MKAKDLQALHRLLDAVINKIEEIGDDGYVAMDISTYSVGVRASGKDSDDWLIYRDCFGSEYCRAAVLDDVIAELNAVEFKQEQSIARDDAPKMDVTEE